MTFFGTTTPDDNGRSCPGKAMCHIYINWMQKAQNFYTSSKANSSFSRTTLFPKVTLLSYWNLACCMLHAYRLHTHPLVSPPVVFHRFTGHGGVIAPRADIPWQLLCSEKQDIPILCQTGSMKLYVVTLKKKHTRSQCDLHRNHNFKYANGVKLQCLI